MDTTDIKLPIYSVFVQILVGVIAFFYLLYVGQGIIVPIIFAIIIAILLNPVVNFLCRHKINRIVAILLALFIAFIFIASLLYFIGLQATKFTESFPQIQQNFSVLFDDMVNWVSATFNISQSDIYVWLEETKAEALGNGADFVSQTIGTISGVSILISLLPVYIFMFLFYKQLLLDFISQLFQRNKHTAVAEVLVETKSLIQNYLVGL
ncbi:MAG: AI-2E family transporter, partial [Bacteroidetes bacterium]